MAPRTLKAFLAGLIARHKMHVIWDSEWNRFDPNFDVIHVLPEGKTCQFPLASLAHEIGHWTGHASRLDRVINAIPRHTPEYDVEKWREEMIAESVAVRLLEGFGGESLRPGKWEFLARVMPSGLDFERERLRAALQAEPALTMLNITEQEN